jgi:hypothetical protein
MNFNTQRLFYIDNFEELNDFRNEYFEIDKNTINKKRGFHANINFNELMIIIEGEIEIKLIDKNLNETIKKLIKNDYIIISKMTWLEFEILKQNTLILVLADLNLEESKSIHIYEDFLSYNK